MARKKPPKSKTPSEKHINKVKGKLQARGIPEGVVRGNWRNSTNAQALIQWLRENSS